MRPQSQPPCDTGDEASAAELRRGQWRQASVLEAALDCIILIDGGGRIIEFNPAAERTFQYTRDEVLGKSIAETIIPPHLRAQHLRGLAHYLRTGESVILRKRIEVVGMRRDGSEFPVELTIIPTPALDSPEFTAYLRDISDRKRIEAERDALVQEVQAAADRQRQFLRDVLLSVTDGKLNLCHDSEDLPAPLSGGDEPILMRDSSMLRLLRRQVEATAQSLNFSDARRHDLLTATGEASMNALVHAGGGVAYVRHSTDTVQVWVTDHGAGIDIARLPQATLEKGYTTAGTLGHGMKLMLATADRLWLLTAPTGTTVVLEQDRIAPLADWLKIALSDERIS